MAEIPQEQGMQFSLKSLLVLTTITCVVAAIPKGYMLLILFFAWLTAIAVIPAILFRFRNPIYRLLAGCEAAETENRKQAS